MRCLAVIVLVFKRIIAVGEVRALTSMLNELSRLDTLIDATSPVFFRDPLVVFIVIMA